MFEYILKLAIMLPLVGGLAWGSLYFWKRLQLGLPVMPERERAARVVDVVSMGTGSKLAVVEFHGAEYLVGVSRAGIALVAKAENAGGGDA